MRIRSGVPNAAHGLLVGVAVTQAAEDSGQLLPGVDRVRERLKEKPQQLLADGGYTTRESVEQMAEREIDFVGSMKWNGVPGGTSAPNRLANQSTVREIRSAAVRSCG